MTNKIKLAEECGLTFTGHKEGEPEFIGTKQQWDLYERTQNSEDNNPQSKKVENVF